MMINTLHGGKYATLLIEERNARAQMMAAIKALQLDLEPVKSHGRPTQAIGFKPREVK